MAWYLFKYSIHLHGAVLRKEWRPTLPPSLYLLICMLFRLIYHHTSIFRSLPVTTIKPVPSMFL